MSEFTDNNSETSVRCDLKIIVIGSPSTGKTSIVNKFTKNIFSNQYKATIAAEFGFKILEVNNQKYRLQLWDIGGQASNFAMTQIFSKDSHGCLVVTDINQIFTDKQIEMSKSQLKEVKFIDGGNIPCILIANKIDLLEDDNINDKKKLTSKLEELQNNFNFDKYFFTSAKTGSGINDAMKYLTEIIVKRIESSGVENFNNNNVRNTIKLEEGRHSYRSLKGENKSCC